MSLMAAVEPIYVIDTHALLWHLTGSKKLSSRAAEVFGAAYRGETQLMISAIVLAELYHLNQKQQSPLDFADIFEQLATTSAYQLVPFEPRHVLDFPRDSAVTELHDRIIAGLARRLDAPLLTLDPIIEASGVARVEW
jgi:PIN domain nuclease of toxin-antitoxin system